MPVTVSGSTADIEERGGFLDELTAIDERFASEPVLYRCIWHAPQGSGTARLAELAALRTSLVEPLAFVASRHGPVVTTNFDVLLEPVRAEVAGAAPIAMFHGTGLMFASALNEPPEAGWYEAADLRAIVQRVGNCKWVYSETREMSSERAAGSQEDFPEWDWIQENEQWIREKFAGLWIAVSHDDLVAIGETEVEALDRAESFGYKHTFTYYVPTGTEAVVVAAG